MSNNNFNQIDLKEENNYQPDFDAIEKMDLSRVKLFFVTKPVAMPISVCGFARQTEQSLNLYIKKLRYIG